MREQRRTPRYKRRLNVRFHAESGRERAAFTSDISRDGLFVICTQPEAPGRLLELVVELPGGGELALTGMVTWVRRIPAQLQSVRRGGFGVEIRLSPGAWSDFLAPFEAPATSPRP